MNQGTDGGRALHSIRQPDVQREHGTLTGASDEHQSQCQRYHCPCGGKRLKLRGERERLCIVSVKQDTDKETQVGKASDDERFLACGDSFRFGVVKPDKQIRRYTHQLPKQVHLEDICCYYQPQHTHCKE